MDAACTSLSENDAKDGASVSPSGARSCPFAFPGRCISYGLRMSAGLVSAVPNYGVIYFGWIDHNITW